MHLSYYDEGLGVKVVVVRSMIVDEGALVDGGATMERRAGDGEATEKDEEDSNELVPTDLKTWSIRLGIHYPHQIDSAVDGGPRWATQDGNLHRRVVNGVGGTVCCQQARTVQSQLPVPVEFIPADEPNDGIYVGPTSRFEGALRKKGTASSELTICPSSSKRTPNPEAKHRLG